jgi:hypothetical protein
MLFPQPSPKASGLNALLQRAGPTARASMTVPALPIHCRSGFSRDAFELSVGAASAAMLLFDIPTESIGPEDPPAKSRSDGAGFDDGSRAADSM